MLANIGDISDTNDQSQGTIMNRGLKKLQDYLTAKELNQRYRKTSPDGGQYCRYSDFNNSAVIIAKLTCQVLAHQSEG